MTNVSIEPNVNVEETELIYCGKPNCPGSTGLRCIRTNVPICSKCAVLVKGVGYISKDAAREQEKKFYNVVPTDYLVVGAISFFGTLVIGFPLNIFLGGIWFLMFLLGPAVGSAIGEVTWRIIGNRRGKYMSQTVTGSIIAASLLLFIIIPSFSVIIFGGMAAFSAAARFQVGLRV